MYSFTESVEILSQNGYTICANNNADEDARKIVVLVHGFGGSSEGRFTSSLTPILNEKGLGVVSFDLPGHGRSPVGGEYFTVKHCLRDLDSVYEYVSFKYPAAKIYLGGTSFGAYLCLLYNSIYEKGSEKLFLRCAALDMKTIFEKKLIGDNLRRLSNYGSVVLDDCERPLHITEQFYRDLNKYSVFDEFKKLNGKYLILHGTKDEIAPYIDVLEFTKEHSLGLYAIDNADHFLSDPAKLSECNINILKFLLED